MNLQTIIHRRNSTIYTVQTSDGQSCIVKQYHRHRGNTRDRLGCEFTALQFLWSNGVRTVPEPIEMVKQDGIGIYRYMAGSVMRHHSIGMEDIRRLTDFLSTLHKLSKTPSAETLPMASEACLCLNDLMNVISQRLHQFTKHQSNRMLHDFLNNKFRPFFQQVTGNVRRDAEKTGVSVDHILPKDKRTLSQSDVGFHNCLRTGDGSLAFVDFEYFGWDDPAKMVSDMFHHPSGNINRRYRRYVVNRVYTYLDNDEEFLARLPLVYCLTALNWCLIMLNVFLESGNEAAKVKQFSHTMKKFARVLAEYRERVFPISPA